MAGRDAKSDESDMPSVEEIFSFWEDPQMLEHIVNAEPMESFIKKLYGEEMREKQRSTSKKDTEPEKICIPSSSQSVTHKKDEKAGISSTSRDSELTSTSYDERLVSMQAAPCGIMWCEYSTDSDESSTDSDESSTDSDESSTDSNKATGSEPVVATSGNKNSRKPNTAQAEIIEDNELTNYPQQSVGKLYWLKVGAGDVSPIYWSTAFYIGGKTIMTVSHVFRGDTLEREALKVNAAMFVPAMINKYDLYGKHYGHYAVKKRKENPFFCEIFYDVPTINFENDIATARPIHGRKLSAIPKGYPDKISTSKLVKKEKKQLLNFTSVDIDSVGLRAIKVVPYVHSRAAKWTVYGYGLNKNGKMSKVIGSFSSHCSCLITFNGQKVSGNNLVKIKAVGVEEGMSGGPWIPSSNTEVANGCTCAGNVCTCAGSGCTCAGTSSKCFSPLFTLDQLNSVEVPNISMGNPSLNKQESSNHPDQGDIEAPNLQSPSSEKQNDQEAVA